MSATNRGGQRRANDFYETPEWVTDAIIDRLGDKLDFSRTLEPAAGMGAITRVIRRRARVPHLTTVELVPGRSLYLKTFVKPNRHFGGDFRSFANLEIKRIHAAADERDKAAAPYDDLGFTTIITNPAFSLAETYVMQCLEMLQPEQGNLLLLLRLAFLESQGRVMLHRRHPSDVYVLPRRPSFTGDGNSDMAAYAWFHWGPSAGGRWEILHEPSRAVERARPALFALPRTA